MSFPPAHSVAKTILRPGSVKFPLGAGELPVGKVPPRGLSEDAYLLGLFMSGAKERIPPGDLTGILCESEGDRRLI